jgi:hypothetical protein
LAGVLWLAGIGSAAALTYELKRPLTLSGQVEVVPAPRVEWTPPPLDERASQAPPAVLALPAVTVVARAVRVHPAIPTPVAHPVAPAEPSPVDISQMRCKEWKELEMGSGRVQVCE